MANIIVLVILIAAVGGAAGYIFKSKRSGKKCIGCPDSGSCSSCCCGCGNNEEM